ncbi:hypothetical protein D5I55_06095 [Chakrabartia godavariana]|nr:hypothetical protein D5I55_06095 [Chakrabartia godavariana]
MKRLIVCILPILLLACGKGDTTVTQEAAQPSSPDVKRSLELRARYHAVQDFGSTAIFIDSVAVHHLYEEASTVLWRDEQGKWQWSQIAEQGPGGLLPIERRMLYNRERQLTPQQSSRLENIVQQKMLYRSADRRTPDPGIGAPIHTMEIVTPYGRATIQWDGRLRGMAGKIADIALGGP